MFVWSSEEPIEGHNTSNEWKLKELGTEFYPQQKYTNNK
jgi:hypothetical protein